MKFVSILFMSVLLAVSMLAGCKEKGREESAETSKQDAVVGVRKDVGQAARESRQTLPQQREDYIKTGETKINQYDETIGKLSQKNPKDKARFDKQIADLRSKEANAKAKLDEVRKAPDQNWEQAKVDLDNALTDLDTSVRQVEQEVDKI